MAFFTKNMFITDFMLSCKGHNSLKNNSILMIFFSKCSGRVDQIVMFFEYITFVDYLGVNCGKQ